MSPILTYLIAAVLVVNMSYASTQKRALQTDHEKPQVEKYMDAFFGRFAAFDQVPSLVNLIGVISSRYLRDCTPIILYDRVVERGEELLLEQLFRHYPIAYQHGQITNSYRVRTGSMLSAGDNKCTAYILFVADVMKCMNVIGEQSENRVVIIARSSQWRVYEFLASEMSRAFVNLLVVAQSEKIVLSTTEELPFILYTHRLYVDGIGSSEPYVLTSWIRGNFTRQDIDLFPRKMVDGFSGHRFVIALANQPPFVIKRGLDENDDAKWDGIEVRLVKLLGQMYNFTTDFREARNVDTLGSGDAVTEEVRLKKANIGIAGIYTTADRLEKVDVTQSHSSDCAAFVTLTSTALPRYRAIMGPFHWTVWLAVTFTYLFAIFPLSFSDRHSFRHLLDNPQEIENMFWYVFGRFTNAFTFTGVKSWDQSDKVTTRILIGFYWLFTIITTACYTGSIIAFVTLPIYPSTIDNIQQLLSGRFQVGTLDKGGWQYWFENSSDPTTIKLLKRLEYVQDVNSGLRNTTKAFFWPYAFLGSSGELDYIIRTNFSTMSKRTLLHISKDCFVPYGVSLIFTLNSVYKSIFNMGVLQVWQSGFLIKFKHDVEWETLRSSTGKLLQANSGNSLKSLTYEDRALTLDDTQGMFLLLALGFILGGASLLSEWFGGCMNFCKGKRRNSTAASIASNPRSHDNMTPRDKINSIQFSDGSQLALAGISDEQESDTCSEQMISDCQVENNNNNHTNNFLDNDSANYIETTNENGNNDGNNNATIDVNHDVNNHLNHDCNSDVNRDVNNVSDNDIMTMSEEIQSMFDINYLLGDENTDNLVNMNSGETLKGDETPTRI